MLLPFALLRNSAPLQTNLSRKRASALVPALTLATCLLVVTGANAQKTAKTDKAGTKPAAKNTSSGKPADKTAHANKPPVAKALPAPTPALLMYQFTPGATYRYRLSALFDGHIPPFAQPDSPPIHIKVDLVYVATVKKVDKTGATVEFNVDSSELSLFDHEIKEDEKIDPDKMTTFPIALEDVQKALNATAVLRPDGSVANILTAGNVKVQIDVGFDLRKLFLLLMPVTLSNQPVKVGDTWPSLDGVLGSKAGRIAYNNKLTDAKLKGKEADYILNQTASSKVEDKLNKEGNSTTKDADVYRTLTGKIDLSGEMTLAAPPNSAVGPLLGQVKSAHILMSANVLRKRVKVDPDHPEIPENDPLDVKARMRIVRENTPPKPGKGAIADTNAKPKNDKSGKSVSPGDKPAATK